MSAQALADAVQLFGLVTHEARLQIDRHKRTRRLRIVVEAPDAVTRDLFEAVAEKAGAIIEANPTRLGLGVRCPAGFVVTCSIPFDDTADRLFALS